LSAEMLATMYAVIDLPTYQLAAGTGGKRDREGVLNDDDPTNSTPPGRRDRRVQKTRDNKVHRP